MFTYVQKRVIQTRGVEYIHALLPLPLTHPERRRLVPLWPLHQGQISCGKSSQITLNNPSLLARLRRHIFLLVLIQRT
jgi:hypothetical protein